jgi:hypothetical protein
MDSQMNRIIPVLLKNWGWDLEDTKFEGLEKLVNLIETS